MPVEDRFKQKSEKSRQISENGPKSRQAPEVGFLKNVEKVTILKISY
jgi:hypothetical protein